MHNLASVLNTLIDDIAVVATKEAIAAANKSNKIEGMVKSFNSVTVAHGNMPMCKAAYESHMTKKIPAVLYEMREGKWFRSREYMGVGHHEIIY